MCNVRPLRMYRSPMLGSKLASRNLRAGRSHPCHSEKSSPDASPEDGSTPPGSNLSASEYETWPATAPPPRRLLLGSLTAAGIALGGNLGGITSFLVGLDGGKFAGTVKLDSIIPVRGLKRCIGQGFEFVYPAAWLADVTIYRRRIEAAEFERGLAYQEFADQERIAKRRRGVEPAVAFGPQGSTGEDNMSVITAPSPGLVLADLGSPEKVATFLLESQLAPAGSGKVAELLGSGSRRDSQGVEYYELEYRVRKEGGDQWRRRNLAVICASNDVLYTFNAQSSADRWPQYAAVFRKAADSFVLR